MDIRLPSPELENMILQYVTKALEDNPEDLVIHAADYFTDLREKTKSETEMDEESKEFINNVLGTRNSRRSTVVGEQYNPEEDDGTDDVKVVPKTDKQRKRIKSQCDKVFLFRVLDDSDLTAVIDAMVPTPVEEGQTIIKQGDDGEYFYLIDHGEFSAEINDPQSNETLVSTYKDEGYFGELALLHNQPRAATVRALSNGFLWAVSRKNFNKLVVKRAFEKRKLYMELLGGVPQLKPLTEYEKMQVADALMGKTYSKGEVIFKEGDEGDGMYFIIEGKVSVRQRKSLDDGIREEEVNQLGKGEYFGGKICLHSHFYLEQMSQMHRGWCIFFLALLW